MAVEVRREPKKARKGLWRPREKRLIRKRKSNKIIMGFFLDLATSRSLVNERNFIKTFGRDHSIGLESGYRSGDNLLSRNSSEGRREVEIRDENTGQGRAGPLAFSISVASVNFPESPRHKRWHPTIPNHRITQSFHYNS